MNTAGVKIENERDEDLIERFKGHVENPGLKKFYNKSRVNNGEQTSEEGIREFLESDDKEYSLIENLKESLKAKLEK